MVVFECQKCNETVKKPKLAKHLEVCQSGWVSCIDCHKVFAWDEWEGHTTCISEAQKYQGNLYQHKESTNKGQQKQDAWVDNVQKRIEDPSVHIAPHIKGLLEKLLGFSNIPRKQKPFANFVKNSLKLWDEKKINDMWEVINAANAKPADGAAANGAAANGAKPAGEEAPTAPAKEGGKAAWAGWKRALDEELREAGGSMPWKKLRDAAVARFLRSGEANGASEEDLGNQALAAVPDSYTSTKDELVRLPSAA